VLGLGTGGLGCYARPGQSWTFHEIDPEVERLARDTRLFHFMEACGNHPRVVLGDGRLTLREVLDHGYDLIMLDAFSSDSIPVHLMTREALALYHRKLAPGGVIVFQISNRYLDLAPVVAALAHDVGAPARHLIYLPSGPATAERFGAEVMVVGEPGGNLDFLTAEQGWEEPP